MSVPRHVANPNKVFRVCCGLLYYVTLLPVFYVFCPVYVLMYHRNVLNSNCHFLYLYGTLFICTYTRSTYTCPLVYQENYLICCNVHVYLVI